MIYRIRSYHGGLGDELMLTTLPEKLTKNGHRVCLLSSKSTEVLPFRNLGIRNFVWGTNPFVDMGENNEGEDGVWNCGDLPNLYSNTHGTFIKNIEFSIGLPPTNNYPKIYYKPNKIFRAPVALVELSGISLKYERWEVEILVRKIRSAFPQHIFYQLKTPAQSNNMRVGEIPEYECNSLFEIYDVLCACKILVTLNSGIHSLAAAAREHNPTCLHYCLIPQADKDWIIESRKFLYPGINYLGTKDKF